MANRPEPDHAISNLNIRDTLIFAEWDRATRSMTDGIEMKENQTPGAAINERGPLQYTMSLPLGQNIYLQPRRLASPDGAAAPDEQFSRAIITLLESPKCV